MIQKLESIESKLIDRYLAFDESASEAEVNGVLADLADVQFMLMCETLAKD